MKDLRSDSSFVPVVILFAVTIILVIAAAAFLITWRAKKVTRAPFTKHPLSMLSTPDRLLGSSTGETAA